MLRSDTRIVESGGNRMRFDHLSVVVLNHVRPRAVENAFAPGGQRGGVLAVFDAETAGLDAKKLDIFIVHEGMKNTDRVRATANTGDDCIGQPARLLEKL